MSLCATPRKRRYATAAAARREALALAFVAGGKVMRAYACRCGWWHLTRLGAPALPGERSS